MGGLADAAEVIDTTSDRQLLIRQNFHRPTIMQTQLQKLHQQITQAKLQHQSQPNSKHAPAQAAQIAAMTQQYRELQVHMSQVHSRNKLEQRKSAEASLGSSHPQVSQQYAPGEGSSSSLSSSGAQIEKAESLSSLNAGRPLNFGFRSSIEMMKPPPQVTEPVKSGFLFRKSMHAFLPC